MGKITRIKQWTQDDVPHLSETFWKWMNWRRNSPRFPRINGIAQIKFTS